jgi:hypothetical protein
MIKDELCIQDPYQLTELKLPFFPPGKKEIFYVIDDMRLPADTRSKWEKKINERIEDCGCQMAGVGFTVAAISYILWIFFGPVKLAELSLTHLWYGLLTAGLGLILGKIIGYMTARAKLNRTIQDIRDEWISQSDFQTSDFVNAL